MTFAQTLKQLRHDARLSQAQAAVLCGVGLRTWQRWEAEPKENEPPTLPSQMAREGIKGALIRQRNLTT